ncbi:MAG: hypothetical protein WC087_02765 [Candidatus Paceibacterota bacterium]
MEKFGLAIPQEQSLETPVVNPTGNPEQDRILQGYNPDQQREIQEKQRQLTSLAYFIGKDFEIPVLLNEPGGSWHWNYQENYIKINPDDLLTRPMEYLRHVISHEGGHRRITKVQGVVSDEILSQPGFSYLFNIVEDGRNDNFVTDAYPTYKEQTKLFFETQQAESDLRKKSYKKLGYVPSFYQASFELLKQWFREYSGKDFEIDQNLSDEVKDVVKKTLPSAQDYWWRYPDREEADDENTVIQYSKQSHEINQKKIWPHFQELMKKDIEFQKVLQVLKTMSDKNDGEIPKELHSKLTEEEKKIVTEIIENNHKVKKEIVSDIHTDVATGEVDMDVVEIEKEKEKAVSQAESSFLAEQVEGMSMELREKLIADVEKKQQEYQEMIEEILNLFKELQDELSEHLQAKMIPENFETADLEDSGQTEETEQPPAIDTPPKEFEKDLEDAKKLFKNAVEKDSGLYDKTRNELLPIIDELENELREIFTARRANKWEPNKRQGKRLSIEKRIQEKAKNIPVVDSKSWETRTFPKEKDYDFSILVDLSGSMHGEKIQEAFKSIIVLAEVLNKLSINLEIIGFNHSLYKYQEFGDHFDDEKRISMEGMIPAVHLPSARGNNDGWAVSQASKDLRVQKGSEKFLIVLSDGLPAYSDRYQTEEYELKKVVQEVSNMTDQKIIGLGIGPQTEHVSNFYPNSIPNITVDKLPETLATLIKQLIAEGNNF